MTRADIRSIAILFLLALLTSSVERSYGQQSQEPKLYVFCEADARAAGGVGAGVKNAADRLKNVFKKVPAKRLVVYNDPKSTWTGPTLRSSKDVGRDIIAAVESCPATQEDSIFFFWSGHGAFDNGGQYFIVPKGREESFLRRRTLVEALKKKGARLTVLFTDCCNVPYDTELHFDHGLGFVPGMPPLFESLFFKSKGFIDFNSSCPGQPSGANKKSGGYCAQTFTATLDTLAKEEKVGWSDVFGFLDDKLQEVTKSRNDWLGAHPSPSRPRLTLFDQRVFCLSTQSGEDGTWVEREDVWSEPTHQPKPGDLIAAINGYKITSVKDFENFLSFADASRSGDQPVEQLVFTVVDPKDHSRYYLSADLAPLPKKTTLGYACANGDGQGVVVRSVKEGTAGARCRLLK